jgi:predicted ATP-dependent endonuclease of OLD family
MYIKKIKIEDIRSIYQFEIEFDEPAGWHVLIGDNGAGKSTIIRSIALCLIGPEDILSLRLNLKEWLPYEKETGFIQLTLSRHEYDNYISNSGSLKKSTFEAILTLKEIEAGQNKIVRAEGNTKVRSKNPRNYLWSGAKGWFSVAFGPFRRFTGGDKDWEKVYYSNPRAAAHLSAFGEDVALTEALDWLKELDYQRLKAIESEETEQPELALYGMLRHFLNTSKLLPQNAQLMEIGPNGPLIIDGNGNKVVVTQMSDGFRSVLSLLFELIRQLIRVYGADAVFENIEENPDNPTIELPGVVLIDEVDVHLHPLWQTRIGQWFTKYFPNIQFIVTTHSPLICRAAEKGSIWRLPTPGTNEIVQQITGVKLNRIIYGNILDSYGTGIFGEEPLISSDSNDKLNELADLNVKSMFGEISNEDEQRLNELRSIFSTKG